MVVDRTGGLRRGAFGLHGIPTGTPKASDGMKKWLWRTLLFTLLAVPLCGGLTYRAWHTPAAAVRLYGAPKGLYPQWQPANPWNAGPVTFLQGATTTNILCWFDGDVFRSTGPLPCSAVPLTTEADGSLLLLSVPFGKNYHMSMEHYVGMADSGETAKLYRYRLGDRSLHEVIAFDDPNFAVYRISENGRVLLAAFVGDTSPLKLRFYDLPSGNLRAETTLPNRYGSLTWSAKRTPAASLSLSPDGATLLVTEGWDDLERTTPEGIELFDTANGKKTGHIGYGGVERKPKVGVGEFYSKDFGSFCFRFQANGEILYSLSQRLRISDDWRLPHHYPWQLYRHGPVRNTMSKSTPIAASEFLGRSMGIWASGEWVIFDEQARSVEVYDDDLRMVLKHEKSSFHTINDGGGSGGGSGSFHALLGTSLFCKSRTMIGGDGEPRGFVMRQLERFGWKPPTRDLCKHYVYNWKTDRTELVVKRTLADGTRFETQFAGHNGGLLVTYHDKANGIVEVELWDLPSQRKPWLYTVPLGCAIAALIVFTSIMLRRNRTTTEGTS